MRRSVLVVLLGSALLVAGCSKKSNNPVEPIAQVPAASSVNFTMHMESGTQGMIFVATPNADVRVTKVLVTYPAEQFADTVSNPDPTTVIGKGQSFQIGEYTGIEMKQLWVLTFTGSEAVTGKPFTVTVRWEVI